MHLAECSGGLLEFLFVVDSIFYSDLCWVVGIVKRITNDVLILTLPKCLVRMLFEQIVKVVSRHEVLLLRRNTNDELILTLHEISIAIEI